MADGTSMQEASWRDCLVSGLAWPWGSEGPSFVVQESINGERIHQDGFAYVMQLVAICTLWQAALQRLTGRLG
jgi:hypothetical protein